MPLLQLGLLLIVALILIVALLAWFIASRRSTPPTFSPENHARIADAKVEPYEREASLVSEQIEQDVRSTLADYPKLADTVFDFGTMPDGSLDVWVNNQQYDNIEDIPDKRIGKAIKDAVKKFNA